jgi:hypothetical protein
MIVPLSISNSNIDGRMRANRWGAAWIVAALLALLLLVGWEAFWRARGFTPGVEDDWNIWSRQRRMVAGNPQVTALIGASRIQLGLDPAEWSRQTDTPAVMLAIDGNSPLPVLRDLAADPDFSGLVLCSYMPLFFAESGESDDRTVKWLRKFRQQKWSSRLETAMSIKIQEHAAFRYAGLTPARLWQHLLDGTAPQPDYAPMGANRYRAADYTITDIAALRAARERRETLRSRNARPLSAQAYARRVAQIAESVAHIRSRGGQVVFVRFPCTGIIRELEEKAWPEERYWKVLLAGTRAPGVHFEEEPTLSGFVCPDGSHLDAGGARRFTTALVEILRRREIIFNHGATPGSRRLP